MISAQIQLKEPKKKDFPHKYPIYVFIQFFGYNFREKNISDYFIV